MIGAGGRIGQGGDRVSLTRRNVDGAHKYYVVVLKRASRDLLRPRPGDEGLEEAPDGRISDHVCVSRYRRWMARSHLTDTEPPQNKKGAPLPERKASPSEYFKILAISGLLAAL